MTASLYQRLLAAGYHRDQVDDVMGIRRLPIEKACDTCKYSRSLRYPFCAQCQRNPKLKDMWRTCS